MSRIINVTIEDLLVDEKYANITLEELEDILDNKISFEEYEELEPNTNSPMTSEEVDIEFKEKAKLLFSQQWGRTL